MGLRQTENQQGPIAHDVSKEMEHWLMERNVIQLEGYSFYLVNIDCMPNSDHFNVVMELEESVDQLLPYLAASFPGCTYIHEAGVINLMDKGHIVAIYPRQVTITDVSAIEDAAGLCKAYFKKIRAVEAQRDTITPVYEKRPSLTVLDILRHLPRTNCGLCQSPTCMAFAAKVFRREQSIAACEALAQDHDRYQKLFQQLQFNGYESQ